MSDNRIRTNIRYYLANDPYFYKVDNLPLVDLVDNDVKLQFQIDQLQNQIGSFTGRATFGELKPYTSEGTPGKVFVSPGSFLARVNIPADRDNGLRERKSDGVFTQPDKKTKAQPEDPDYGLNSPDEAGGIARTALVRVLSEGGIDPGVPIPKFTSEDYPDADVGSNPAPLYRLDVVYIEAYPAEDNDNAKPKVGMIQGGFFMSKPDTISEERKGAQRFTGNDYRQGRTLLQKTEELNAANIIDDKKGNLTGGVDGLRYTTVPLPEDLKNFEYRPLAGDSDSLISTPNFSDENSDFDESKISDWLNGMSDTRGVFCLPVCYILTPFGYAGNTHIPTDNIMDIRPFFRTAEMTFDERQALATSYRPSFRNRFLTRKDPDYLALRDSWVRGSGTSFPGNHEGRVKFLEDELHQEVVLLDSEVELGTMTTQSVSWTPSESDIPVEDNVVAVLVRVSLGISGDTSTAKVKYTNQNGKVHTIARGWCDINGGTPNSMRTQTDTILQYIKAGGDPLTAMDFEPIGLANGNAKVYIYAYIRLV